MTPTNRVLINNSLFQAAVIASDQTYGHTEPGFNLQWVDNSSTGIQQPFGAFYDSAASIANKTTRALNASGQVAKVAINDSHWRQVA